MKDIHTQKINYLKLADSQVIIMDCMNYLTLRIYMYLLRFLLQLLREGEVLCGNSREIRPGARRCRQLYSYPDGQVDFAETTETENGNGNTEGKKKKSRQLRYCVKNFKTVFYFVHSWLGCYMLGRGETEFCSCTTHLIVQSISSPFEHCVLCSACSRVSG